VVSGRSLADAEPNAGVEVVAAQKAATGTKPASRRHGILTAVGGIALGLLIGAGLLVAVALHG
jgi:hypothetical protein